MGRLMREEFQQPEILGRERVACLFIRIMGLGGWRHNSQFMRQTYSANDHTTLLHGYSGDRAKRFVGIHARAQRIALIIFDELSLAGNHDSPGQPFTTMEPRPRIVLME